MRRADADQRVDVVHGVDLGAQPLLLRAQQRALALDVYQAQFCGRAIREQRAHRALHGVHLRGPIEPGTQVAEHGPVLGSQRHAEVGAARRGRTGRLAPVLDEQCLAGVHLGAGRALEHVLVVGHHRPVAPCRERARATAMRSLTDQRLACVEHAGQVLHQDREEILSARASQARRQHFELFARACFRHTPTLY